jgi:hypothetical protein
MVRERVRAADPGSLGMEEVDESGVQSILLGSHASSQADVTKTKKGCSQGRSFISETL